MHQRAPDANVYDVPFFAKNRILSNEMCQILVFLLHKSPKYRFQSLEQVKEQLILLRKNIFATTRMLRQLLGHPYLPGENLPELSPNQKIDFRDQEISKFSLKYLAKFVCEHPIQSICINGGSIPIKRIQTDSLVKLELRDSGLFSEDLFILSQVLKNNTSLKHIDLSKNMIGYTYVQERKVLEIKMKN